MVAAGKVSGYWTVQQVRRFRQVDSNVVSLEPVRVNVRERLQVGRLDAVSVMPSAYAPPKITFLQLVKQIWVDFSMSDVFGVSLARSSS
jgi:hypothetical protein